MSADRIFSCRDCGRSVAWRTAKSGRRYLAQPLEWNGTETLTSRVYWPSHACTPDPERVATIAAERAALEVEAAAALASAIAEGRIVKGAPVEVVRGRKVAKGTTGVVFWVAPEPDAYDVVKVGFATISGEKHFVNIANLEVVQ